MLKAMSASVLNSTLWDFLSFILSAGICLTPCAISSVRAPLTSVIRVAVAMIIRRAPLTGDGWAMQYSTTLFKFFNRWCFVMFRLMNLVTWRQKSIEVPSLARRIYTRAIATHSTLVHDGGNSRSDSIGHFRLVVPDRFKSFENIVFWSLGIASSLVIDAKRTDSTKIFVVPFSVNRISSLVIPDSIWPFDTQSCDRHFLLQNFAPMCSISVTKISGANSTFWRIETYHSTSFDGFWRSLTHSKSHKTKGFEVYQPQSPCKSSYFQQCILKDTMAEGEGFEPSVPDWTRRLSRAVHSTTLPPFRTAQIFLQLNRVNRRESALYKRF